MGRLLLQGIGTQLLLAAVAAAAGLLYYSLHLCSCCHGCSVYLPVFAGQFGALPTFDESGDIGRLAACSDRVLPLQKW